MRKLREQHKERRVPERKELFLACLRIAERMQRQGTRVISEDELKQLISADANIAWLEQFELGGRSLLNRNSDRAFRFSHYTVQEFLLAWGILQKQLAEQTPLRATDQLVRFTVLVGFVDLFNGQLDFTGFNWKGYADLYGTLSFRNILSKGNAAPDMVCLPGGRFRMGDIQGKGGKDERPVHEVELDSFAIGRYPVTVAEYDAFCEATSKNKPECERWRYRKQQPVINVSWNDAVAYCQWLSQETGLPYRLPTEAEWEYACRAGSEYAWYSKKYSCNSVTSVGWKKANAWGLYDMHGNVWEWCADWYDAGYYTVSPKENPQGPENGSHRVFRGGSWNNTPKDVRAAARVSAVPDYRNDVLGFRIALSLPPVRSL